MTHSRHAIDLKRKPRRAVGFGGIKRVKNVAKLALRIMGVCVLLVALSCTCTYRYLVYNPQILHSMVNAALSDVLGIPVDFDVIEPHLDGTITIHNVSLTVPNVAEAGSELLYAPRIELRCGMWDSLFGGIAIHSVAVREPVIQSTLDEERGMTNLQVFGRLLERLERKPDDGPMPALPSVTIANGCVRYGYVREGRYQQSNTFRFSGRLLPEGTGPSNYEFWFVQPVTNKLDSGSAATISGKLDLDDFKIGIDLENFAFDDHRKQMLPPWVQSWWDLFEPAGALSKVEFAFDPQLGPRALIQIHGGQMTLPRFEDKCERARLTNVRGSFHLDSHEIRVENLTGLCENVEYSVHGFIKDYVEHGGDSVFSLSLSTQTFEVDELMKRHVLPHPAMKTLNELALKGPVRVAVTLNRDQVGEELDFNGTLSLLGVQMAYFQFDYRVDQVRGEMHFNPDKFWFDRLTGFAADNKPMSAYGSIVPPGEHPKVNIVITGEQLPFEDRLRAAFGESDTRLIDLFFSETHYASLVERGAIRAPTTRSQSDEASDIPVFPMDAHGDVKITIDRAFGGTKKDFKVAVTVDRLRAHMVYEDFPFPVELTDGKLIIQDKTVLIPEDEPVVLECLHGGGGTLHGTIALNRSNGNSDRPFIADLQLDAKSLNVTPLLVDSLPSPMDTWLAKLNVSGLTDAAGRIYSLDNGEAELDLNLNLRSMNAKPDQPKVDITQITGMVHATRSGVQTEGVSGLINGRVMTMVGKVAPSKDGQPDVDLKLGIKDLSIEKDLLELSKLEGVGIPDLDPFWKRYQPQGSLCIDVTCRVDESGKFQPDVAFMPKSLSFLHDAKRHHWNDMSGKIRFADGTAALQDVTGKFNDVPLKIGGDIRFADQWQANLKASTGETSVKALTALPFVNALQPMTNDLALAGKVVVNLDKLIVDRTKDGKVITDLRGLVRMNKVSGRIGFDVSEFDGELGVTATIHEDAPIPDFELTILGKQFVAKGRTIKDLYGQVKNVPGTRQIMSQGMQAQIGNGSLEGNGWVDLDESRYRIRLIVNDADLSSLLAPSEDKTESTEQASKGKVSISLVMEGDVNDSTKRRGKGNVIIRDAMLYRIPLTMGLLELTHLSLPVSRHFNQGSIAYYLEGNQLTFEQLQLKSSQISIVGNGTIDSDTKGLNLILTTHNPKGLDLGPITQLIDGLRNQLVTIKVSGTVDKPQLKVKHLNDLLDF